MTQIGLAKIGLKNDKAIQQFMADHVRTGVNCFQIGKCGKKTCSVFKKCHVVCEFFQTDGRKK